MGVSRVEVYAWVWAFQPAVCVCLGDNWVALPTKVGRSVDLFVGVSGMTEGVPVSDWSPSRPTGVPETEWGVTSGKRGHRINNS